MIGTVAAQVARDRWGRPLIKQADGTTVAYTRASVLAKTLDDNRGLIGWMQRMTAIGLVDRPDLLLATAAHRDDKDQLNRIVEQAVEAAKAHSKATIGTALHTFTDKIDAGEPTGPVPGEFQRDLDAYIEATREFTVVQSERFVVCDEVKVAGTPDRIVTYAGSNYIADLKTGSISYAGLRIAIQLALYAHSEAYNPATGARTPLPDVDQAWGIVIHCPQGEGATTLHWVDLTSGWAAVAACIDVRNWRKEKELITPFAPTMEAAIANVDSGGLLEDDPILTQIRAASTIGQLTRVWSANQNRWTDEHTAAAAFAKELLRIIED